MIKQVKLPELYNFTSPNTGGEVLGNVIIAVFNNADAKDPHTLLFRMITDLDDGLAVLR